MGWERIGAGGKQHGNNGAVLASAWGMGRGRHLPAPSPALPTNYTNSTATAPSAEAKGPGGRGACGEPRGAWCRRLGRRGEALRGRVRELGKQHSPKLTTTRITFGRGRDQGGVFRYFGRQIGCLVARVRASNGLPVLAAQNEAAAPGLLISGNR